MIVFKRRDKVKVVDFPGLNGTVGEVVGIESGQYRRAVYNKYWVYSEDFKHPYLESDGLRWFYHREIELI